MPARSPSIGKVTAAQLKAIGASLRAHRKALQVSATTAAEAAGMSRVTLHRIERGEPSVTAGAYVSAVAALGLHLELDSTGRAKTKPVLPKSIRLSAYAQLKSIAWQLGDTTSLTPREVLALYRRNWRHVDATEMNEEERAFVRTLVETFGGSRLV